MRRKTTTSILLIGIGNEYRSDDSLGLVALRNLRAMHLPGVRCVESNGDTTELADLLSQESQAAKVILIDAISSGAQPGTIHRLDASQGLLPAHLSFSSTHSMGLAEALQLARLFGELPTHLTILGIEGQSFAMGTDLSPAVEQAVDELVALVVREVETGSGDGAFHHFDL